jgi:hypothetical protein
MFRYDEHFDAVFPHRANQNNNAKSENATLKVLIRPVLGPIAMPS